jgi:hypothetical protein
MSMQQHMAGPFTWAVGIVILVQFTPAPPASAAVLNISAGKPVTLLGTFGVIGPVNPFGFPGTDVYPLPDPSSLLDSVFRPEGTYWQSGTIWWNEAYPDSTGNAILIDLQGSYAIAGITIQADNNDMYQVEARANAGPWMPVCSIGTFAGSGIRTRPVVWLISPVLADTIRIRAIVGDTYCGISEIQVWGTLPGAPINAAFGKPVTLVGTFGEIGTGAENPSNLSGADVYPLPAASTLVDNVFRPVTAQWQNGSIWWNARVPASQANQVLIDLQGFHRVLGITAQADNNDTFRVEGRDDLGAWIALCDVPIWPGKGVQTRPMVPVVVATAVDALRITYTSGDYYTSLSEIKAWALPPAASGNLALGKPVTLTGTFGVIGADNPQSWPDAGTYPLARAASLTDGLFIPERTQWQDGSVWWNERNPGSQANAILLDLQGSYRLAAMIVQCDNDDAFRVEGRVGQSGWVTLCEVPIVETSWGTTTREPLPVLFPGAVSELRITCTSGDLYDSVTEIQAFGTPALAGDVNGDGHVDVVDLLYLVDAFGSVSGDANFDPWCDFNSDGAVDVVDLLDLVYNFGA